MNHHPDKKYEHKMKYHVDKRYWEKMHIQANKRSGTLFFGCLEHCFSVVTFQHFSD